MGRVSGLVAKSGEVLKRINCIRDNLIFRTRLNTKASINYVFDILMISSIVKFDSSSKSRFGFQTKGGQGSRTKDVAQ